MANATIRRTVMRRMWIPSSPIASLPSKWPSRSWGGSRSRSPLPFLALAGSSTMTPSLSSRWESVAQRLPQGPPQTRSLSSNATAYGDGGDSVGLGDRGDDPAAPAPSSPFHPRQKLRRRVGVRNVAIIAHVDHGKTTLVDQLLRSAASASASASAGWREGGTAARGPADDSGNSNSSNHTAASGATTTTDRLLDCGDLEKERGITITSKVTRIDDYLYNGARHTINVVDTPGHADFCGEVDRVLSLVDGVCLVVDAAEGPMAQTKYVLSRALALNLPPIVVLNKVDRPDGWNRVESGETESDLLDLLDALGASETVMDRYVTVYASARDGWVTDDVNVAHAIVHSRGREAVLSSGEGGGDNVGMTALLDRIIQAIPEPIVHWHGTDEDGDNDSDNNEDDIIQSLPGEAFAADKFSLAVVTVGYDAYLGRTCTGRVYSGSVSINDQVGVVPRDQQQRPTNDGKNTTSTATAAAATTAVATSTLKGIFVQKGISRVPLEGNVAYAGDIVLLAGVPDSIAVGDTLTGTGGNGNNAVSRPIPTPPLAPPTLSMEFGANNGPLAGTEGTEVTPSKLRDRLRAETDNNVTLTVKVSPSDGDKTAVFARGELQLGILIEQMRREGFEMVISPPKIVTKIDESDGKTLMEPMEEVTVDVDAEYAGYIVSSLTGDRKGVLLEMNESTNAKTRLRLEVPSRGLLGFPSEAASATRGTAIVNHVYLEDRKYMGPLGDGLEKGKLISSESGRATQYALASLSARGVLFIEPGDVVYPGMIIGENAKDGDLEVNPVRAKAVTNMRTQAKDEKVYLAPPKRMTVEEMIGYMAPDEMIEVTPTALRLRKAELDPVERRKASRVKKQQADAIRRK